MCHYVTGELRHKKMKQKSIVRLYRTYIGIQLSRNQMKLQFSAVLKVKESKRYTHTHSHIYVYILMSKAEYIERNSSDNQYQTSNSLFNCHFVDIIYAKKKEKKILYLTRATT